MRDYDEQVKLVKALRYCADHPICFSLKCPYRTTPRASSCFDFLKRAAADAIEELLAAVPKWISVEERLPELNQEVFVYAVGQTDGFFGDSVITKCKRYIFKLFPSSEGFENWSSPWQYFHTDYKITHWMPLPEPPKEME